jgi:NAD(P)-dependent dehydrogenase (short-subunit alcohol dehydrogenase family)
VPGSVASEKGLLSGKNILITGAGPNIGKSLALEMGKQGCQIFFTDLNTSGISDLEKQLQHQQVSNKGFAFDITKTQDADSLCAFFDQNNQSIDVLVHNAGLEFKNSNSLIDLNLQEWVKTFETNVFGPMYLTKCIVERMIRQGNPASIIFITSMHQFLPNRRISYSSSKAALGMVVKELAVELATHGIRVNGIAPGWVKVDDQGNPRPHPYTPLYKSSIIPEFIGRAAVYLASEYYSHFTTGTVLTVDGGLSLYNSRIAEASKGNNP